MRISRNSLGSPLRTTDELYIQTQQALMAIHMKKLTAAGIPMPPLVKMIKNQGIEEVEDTITSGLVLTSR